MELSWIMFGCAVLFGALLYQERKEARLSAKIALAFGVIAAIALGTLNLIYEFKVN